MFTICIAFRHLNPLLYRWPTVPPPTTTASYLFFPFFYRFICRAYVVTFIFHGYA